MRIVFLLPMGIERPSGRRYFQIARELVQQGNTVRLLALHPDLQTCNQRRFIQDGVEVWYVGQMHARKSTSVPSRFGAFALLKILIGATLGMVWGIICSPADAYHLGKPQPVNGLAAIIGVMLLRRQRFYVDCDDDEVGSNRLNGRWQRVIFRFWQWFLPRIASGVTVNTQFQAGQLRQASLKHIVYVPNGVDLQQTTRPPEDVMAALRHQLGLTDGRTIAYAGTLALHNHPVDLLLAAFAELAHTNGGINLLLIGGGEDLPVLQREVEGLQLGDLVYFTGQVPHHRVRDYLALAVVSVDPVVDDVVARARSPLKVFESMALMVPVVTGDVGDRAVVLDHGHAGILVAPGDVAALAAGLQQLLADEPLRIRLSEAAYVRVQQYGWDRLAKQWQTVYEN
ncbi:MAG: glycosyltransferase [Herpetosiphonaceae bacterium]|nr:glycosyltransferase [Herpetosiphonaceae bacterium]